MGVPLCVTTSPTSRSPSARLPSCCSRWPYCLLAPMTPNRTSTRASNCPQREETGGGELKPHQARKATPDDPVILYSIGFINLQEQKYADALEPLNRPIKLDPTSADAYLDLGNVYDDLKHYDEAVADAFETVIKLDPKSADAHYNLGSVYYNRSACRRPPRPYRPPARSIPRPVHSAKPRYVLRRQAICPPPSPRMSRRVQFQAETPTCGSTSASPRAEPPAKRLRRLRPKPPRQSPHCLARAIQAAPNRYCRSARPTRDAGEPGRAPEAIPRFEKAAQVTRSRSRLSTISVWSI